jgi:hypothetical protein
MTEQHQPNSAGHPNSTEGYYDWSNVADEMAGWDPNLRQIAAVHVAANGLRSMAEHNDAIPAPSAVSELRRHPSATERNAKSPEAMARGMTEGRSMLYRATASEAFHEACERKKVDPFDETQPAYWTVLAEYAATEIAAERKEQGESVRLRAYELLSETPRALFAQLNIDRGDFIPPDQYKGYVGTLSRFNNRIRAFGRDYPQTRASMLEKALNGAVAMSMEDPNQQQAASREAKGRIRSNQHELIFGQLVEAAGHTWAPADERQDLDGEDGTVDDGLSTRLLIDVKSAGGKLKSFGIKDKLFVVTRERKVIMSSHMSDEEMPDSFHVSEAVAQAKAPIINNTLAKALAEVTELRRPRAS